MFPYAVLAIFALNVLTPGASFVLTVRNALAHGKRTGLFIALGLACADGLYASLALMGLAAVLQANSMVASAIGLLAGMWLFNIGVKLFMSRHGNLEAETASHQGELARAKAFQLGILTGLSNAQAIVFFSTVFVGGMATTTMGHADALVLVGGLMAVSAGLRTLISQLFTLKAVREVYFARKRTLETLSAMALMAFGVKVAVKAMLVPLALLMAA